MKAYMAKRIAVAIDGPAGSGKSTVARLAAERLGYLHVNSGAMYRAIAWWAKQNGTPLDDAAKLTELARAAELSLADGNVRLNGRDITAELAALGAEASQVATVRGVREALVEKQRQYRAAGCVVMEGRDIGTVVFPDAEVKIYLDASPMERARRRHGEHGGDLEAIARQIAERDDRDRTRADSPLRQAPDALYVNTDGKSIDEVVEIVLKAVRDRTANGKEVYR
jgi:cytidylate kinase